mmetsp:Transcript_86031/g.230209  ORF Transcript_86031/g.230209 Transcript_86031/m.230209 type:complete len:616 (+) Transcript_86031:2-1849(+)
MAEVLLTTNPGLEAIAAEEAATLLAEVSPRGRGLLCVQLAAPYDLPSLRCVHDALLVRHSFPLPVAADVPLAIYDYLSSNTDWSIPELETASSFRVTCAVSANLHPSEVEREVGGAIFERYGVKADMRRPDIVVRADIFGSGVILSRLINREPLSKRKYQFSRGVSVKTTVAAAMLRAAGVAAGGVVLDPFCGAGTILLEATHCHNNKLRCIGTDRSKAAVEGAQVNVTDAGSHSITLKHLTIGDLQDFLPPSSVDFVVTNLPWGVRSAKTEEFSKLYGRFLWQSWRVLRPSGIVVALTVHYEQLLEIARVQGQWEIQQVTAVQTGQQVPVMIRLRRLDRDPWISAIKNQVAALGVGRVAAHEVELSSSDLFVILARSANDHIRGRQSLLAKWVSPMNVVVVVDDEPEVPCPDVWWAAGDSTAALGLRKLTAVRGKDVTAWEKAIRFLQGRQYRYCWLCEEDVLFTDRGALREMLCEKEADLVAKYITDSATQPEWQHWCDASKAGWAEGILPRPWFASFNVFCRVSRRLVDEVLVTCAAHDKGVFEEVLLLTLVKQRDWTFVNLDKKRSAGLRFRRDRNQRDWDETSVRAAMGRGAIAFHPVVDQQVFAVFETG